MQSKYKNQKTQIDMYVFDSAKEAQRYRELTLLERAGEISNLELQPRFLLQDSFKYENKINRAISYIADFKYYDCNLQKMVVEDVKSNITKKDKVYVIKKKLFLKKYGKDFLFKEVE